MHSESLRPGTELTLQPSMSPLLCSNPSCSPHIVLASPPVLERLGLLPYTDGPIQSQLQRGFLLLCSQLCEQHLQTTLHSLGDRQEQEIQRLGRRWYYALGRPTGDRIGIINPAANASTAIDSSEAPSASAATAPPIPATSVTA